MKISFFDLLPKFPFTPTEFHIHTGLVFTLVTKVLSLPLSEDSFVMVPLGCSEFVVSLW